MPKDVIRQRIKNEDWRLCVMNPNAVDPQEVIYQLVRINKEGKIIDKDAQIFGGEHGKFILLKNAMKKKFLKLKSKSYEDPQWVEEI